MANARTFWLKGVDNTSADGIWLQFRYVFFDFFSIRQEITNFSYVFADALFFNEIQRSK